jgi:DNA polymerase elongation subunit (family B)
MSSSENDDIVFQALEFVSKDVLEEYPVQKETESGRIYTATEKEKKFIIQIFGLTEEGKTTCATVRGFRPYFFVGIPENQNTEAFHRTLKKYILSGLSERAKTQVVLDQKKFKVLYDFNNHKEIPVIEVSCPSKDVYNKIKSQFLDKDSNVLPLRVGGSDIQIKVYEANIDPMLRFFHARDISPSGWVRLKDTEENTERNETADLNVTVEVDEIYPEKKLGAAPFKIISWDIECMSSHGDFPVAKKNYRKVAREIVAGKWTDPATQIFNELDQAAQGKTTEHLSFIQLKNMKHWEPPNARAQKHILDILKSQSKAELKTDEITRILGSVLPEIEGDRCIQIGMVMWINNKPVEKWIYTLGSCDPVQSEDNIPVHTYPFPSQDDNGEEAMLRKWINDLGRINPDILIGYNVFGFDEKYVWERLDELGLINVNNNRSNLDQRLATNISRIKTAKVSLKEQKLSSGAMGDNLFYIIEMPGRLQIDLLPYIRRNFNLQSYSLDSVSSHFMAGELKAPLKEDGATIKIVSKSTKGLRPGRYIVILDAENDKLSDKMEVLQMTEKEIVVNAPAGTLQEILENGQPRFWCMVKDDVSPQDIFRLQKGSSLDRSIVAKYCLQDCDLVMDLFNKLDALRNAQAMADVCCVPTGYIYMRGQGVKIESLIFKECMKQGQIIEVLPSQGFGDAVEVFDLHPETDSDAEEEEDSYEGAIVLEPKTGIYLDDPIATLDFASLYPSTIISENLSHDTLIWVKDFAEDGTVTIREGSEEYDNLPQYKYVNVEFDILKNDPADTRKNPAKIKAGLRIARYVQFANSEKGTIPKILKNLLAARKATRKLIETEKDDFKRTLLDCQQNAYKITANSLYGQLGSKTFKIRRIVLAASTTAYGRKQLMYAKSVVEEIYVPSSAPSTWKDTIIAEMKALASERATMKGPLSHLQEITPEGEVYLRSLSYKDLRTAQKGQRMLESSYFVSNNHGYTKWLGANKPSSNSTDSETRCSATYVYGDTDSVFINFRATGVKGEAALQPVKDLAIEAGQLCTSSLKAPHDFEYDKIMWPFCLLSKKRYVGNKYEDDLTKPTMTSMGIVMKRRDNAPIVKVLYGGVIDRILQKHDIVDAFYYSQRVAKDLILGSYGLTKLTITKSLRAEYANPERIAHKVLADRIGARDPGNKPTSSERIGYVYIATPKGQPEPKLQGDRIETVAFIRANKLTPDYAYYIERQIAKPVSQVFALVLESLPGFKKQMIPADLTEKQIVAKRQKIAEQLLFGEILMNWKNKQIGQRDLRSMFPRS